MRKSCCILNANPYEVGQIVYVSKEYAKMLPQPPGVHAGDPVTILGVNGDILRVQYSDGTIKDANWQWFANTSATDR